MMRKIVIVIAISVVAGLGLTLSWSLLALSVFCVAVLGLCLFSTKPHQGINVQKIDWLVLGVASYFVMRALSSPVWDLAKEDLLLVAGGLITYYLSRLHRPTRGWVMYLVGYVVLNLMVYFFQMAGVSLWLPLWGVCESASESPSFGLFQDYGALGNAMAMVAMILLSYALYAKQAGAKRRWLVGVASGLAMTLVYLSGSRSAVLAVAVSGSLAIPVLWSQIGKLDEGVRNRARLFLVLGVCCVGVLVVMLSLKTFADRDGAVLQTGVVTESNVRQGYWGMAVDQWQDSVLLGQGARAYSYESNRYWDGVLSASDVSPEFVHNEYLQVLADYGAIGLVLLLALFGVHWFSALKAFSMESRMSRSQWLRLAGLLGLTVLMVHSFTDFPLRLPFNMFLGAFVLGCCVPNRIKAKQRKETNNSSELSAQSPVDEAGKWRGESGKGKGLSVVLLVLSAGVLIFSGREIWAAAPILGEKQAREDGGWSPVGKGHMLNAYIQANERSPDFRRSQRVAQMYHVNYERGDEGAFSQAESYYKESITRHPYNPVSLMNLANLYRESGRFAESEEFYDRVEPYVASRDKHFEYYQQRARLKIAQSESAYRDGKLELAEKYLVEAAEVVMLGHAAVVARQKVQRDCNVARVRIAVERGDYEKAVGIWSETKAQLKPWVLRERGATHYLHMGDIYFFKANEVWQERKPELAKELFLIAQKFYKRDRGVRGGETDAQREERLLLIQQALNVFREGGI